MIAASWTNLQDTRLECALQKTMCNVWIVIECARLSLNGGVQVAPLQHKQQQLHLTLALQLAVAACAMMALICEPCLIICLFFCCKSSESKPNCQFFFSQLDSCYSSAVLKFGMQSFDFKSFPIDHFIFTNLLLLPLKVVSRLVWLVCVFLRFVHLWWNIVFFCKLIFTFASRFEIDGCCLTNCSFNNIIKKQYQFNS